MDRLARQIILGGRASCTGFRRRLAALILPERDADEGRERDTRGDEVVGAHLQIGDLETGPARIRIAAADDRLVQGKGSPLVPEAETEPGRKLPLGREVVAPQDAETNIGRRAVDVGVAAEIPTVVVDEAEPVLEIAAQVQIRAEAVPGVQPEGQLAGDVIAEIAVSTVGWRPKLARRPSVARAQADLESRIGGKGRRRG